MDKSLIPLDLGESCVWAILQVFVTLMLKHRLYGYKWNSIHLWSHLSVKLLELWITYFSNSWEVYIYYSGWFIEVSFSLSLRTLCRLGRTWKYYKIFFFNFLFIFLLAVLQMVYWSRSSHEIRGYLSSLICSWIPWVTMISDAIHVLFSFFRQKRNISITWGR